MLEKDFGHQIEHLLQLFGWRWKHDLPALYRDGRMATTFAGDKGFPDYIAVRHTRLIFAEIKNERGRLTHAQADWLDDLRTVPHVETYVWRPDQLQEIKDILR